MSVYLAARYDRREELRGYAGDLRDRGITVTSRWLHGEDTGLGGAACALADLEDIRAAGTLIAFTEDPAFYKPGSSRGGRHVELGYALARPGMRVIACGPPENQFCHLPQVERYASWPEILAVFDSDAEAAFGFSTWGMKRLAVQREHLEALLAVSAGQDDPVRPQLRAEYKAVCAEMARRAAAPGGPR